VHAHDLALQTVLDAGLIGLAVLTVVVTMALRRLARLGNPALALVAMLVTVILCGATEVTPTYYSQEALIMTLLAMGVATRAVGTRPAAGASRIEESAARWSHRLPSQQPRATAARMATPRNP
jgi:O-antigen ligase